MRLPVLKKNIAELFETLMGIFRSRSHRSSSLRYVCLQIFDEKRWLTVRGCGYDGRFVRLDSQLEEVGRRRHVVYKQAR
jgi:hypothetical protein